MYPDTVPPIAGGPGGPPPHVPAEGEAGHERLVIVLGDNGLTLRFIKNLTERFSYRVTALIKPGPGAQRDEIRKESEVNPRLTVVEEQQLSSQTIRKAGLLEAYAVALMAQDDVANLHLALEIREMSHQLGDDTLPRLVIRMYNRQLRDRIRLLLGDQGIYVESDADMVARTYAAAALQQIPPGDIDIWDRRLYLTREPDERAQAQWVVASDNDNGDNGGLEVITENRKKSVRVLCLEPERSHRWFRPEPGAAVRFLRRTMYGLRRTVDTKLRIAAVVLIIVMSGGFWTLTHFASIANPVGNAWDALYIITLMAGGGIDPEMAAQPWVKVTHAVVVVAGALIIPVVTGAIVQALVGRRYALAEGRIVDSVRDHVIVVGLGNLGTRVVERLRALKIPVVAIEKDRDAIGIQAARAAGAQVLLGDASRPETLREAEIRYCRSLVAMAKQDSQNLETALSGLECKSDLRTVMRIYSPEFAALVRRNLNTRTSPRDASRHSSYSAPEVAAASFAAALTEDEILETIPVRGELVYIGEVVVGAGGRLDDARAQEATALGSHRLLAVKRASGGVRWNPDAAFSIQAGDKLLVLATRPGLEEVLHRCQPTAELPR
ncbi:potassium channel family protein [Glycomyces arizonensis]|uniref:potassium channel family protein n=1 Tax=Glycomyces arizonensis TaxID=256035 RepID=UPI000A009A01|nr:potassium channel protein [Glycomyces arizonensis]